MTVFNYNVTTPSRRYAAKGPSTFPDFEEKLLRKDMARPEWDKMMLYVQKESVRARETAEKNKRINAMHKYPNQLSEEPETVLIRMESLEALQAPNEDFFEKMIARAIQYGATIHSLKEDVVFSKEFPRGFSDPDKPEFSIAMRNLRKTWNKSENKKEETPLVQASVIRKRPIIEI